MTREYGKGYDEGYEDGLKDAPQRKPLTDEQIKHLAIDVYSPHQEPLIVFARAIEAAHGIKE